MPNCPRCKSPKVIKAGTRKPATGPKFQMLRCNECGHLFKGETVEPK